MSLLNLNFKICQHCFRLLPYGLKALLGNFYLKFNLSFYVQLNKNNLYGNLSFQSRNISLIHKTLLTYIENKPLLKGRQVERFVKESLHFSPTNSNIQEFAHSFSYWFIYLEFYWLSTMW